MESIMAKGSGYSLTKIQYSQILISNCKSLDTVGHSTSLNLKSIRNYAQIINLKGSPQNECFLGALAAAMLYDDIIRHNKIVKQRQKKSNGNKDSKSRIIDALDHNNEIYSAFIDRLDLSGVQFPIDSSGILRIFKLNPWLNAQANLYCFYDAKVFPLKIGIGRKVKSQSKKPKKILHFLNFDLNENAQSKSVFEVAHCLAIKVVNLEMFLPQVHVFQPMIFTGHGQILDQKLSRWK